MIVAAISSMDFEVDDRNGMPCLRNISSQASTSARQLGSDA